MSGVGSNPVLATCETSQVLLAGVPGGFFRGSPVFAQLLIFILHVYVSALLMSHLWDFDPGEDM